MSDLNRPEAAACTHADQARWLMLVIRELRELKLDLPLVRLDDDGVTETNLNLTDELWLIAFQINHAVAMEPMHDTDGTLLPGQREAPDVALGRCQVLIQCHREIGHDGGHEARAASA